MAPLRTVVLSHSHKTTCGWSSSLLVLIIISLCFCGPLHRGTPCILKHFIDGAVWHSYLYVLVVLQWFFLFLWSEPFVKWCEEDVYSNLGPMNWVLSGNKRKYWGFNILDPLLLLWNIMELFFLPGTESKTVEEVKWAAYTWFGVQEQSYQVTMLTGGSLLSILLHQEWTAKLPLPPPPESPSPNNVSFISQFLINVQVKS